MNTYAEIWEANETGAHFKVTKEKLFSPKHRQYFTFYALSVSGLLMGRIQVMDDFIRTLGGPLTPVSDTDLLKPTPTFTLWDANYVDTNLLNKPQ